MAATSRLVLRRNEAAGSGGEAAKAEVNPASSPALLARGPDAGGSPPQVADRGEATLTFVERDTIDFQPEPVDVLVARTRSASGDHVTIIWREWERRDVERCHLCPIAECQARRDARPRCMIPVPDQIADADTPLFSLTEWRLRTGLVGPVPGRPAVAAAPGAAVEG